MDSTAASLVVVAVEFVVEIVGHFEDLIDAVGATVVVVVVAAAVRTADLGTVVVQAMVVCENSLLGTVANRTHLVVAAAADTVSYLSCLLDVTLDSAL